MVVFEEELRSDEGKKKQEGGDEVMGEETEELTNAEASEEKTEEVVQEEIVGQEEEDDCVEVTRETAETSDTGAADKAKRRITRFSRRLARILDEGGVKVKLEKVAKAVADPSGVEEKEEEDEEIPLKRKAKTGKATDQVAPSSEVPGEPATIYPPAGTDEPRPMDRAATKKVTTPPSKQSTLEKQITEEGSGETETQKEERYQQETKRKGKQPAKPAKKKARRANPTVAIQEPIQVPFRQAPSYEKFYVELDDGLLDAMKKFDDPKLQASYDAKKEQKKDIKSGKIVHIPSLKELAAESTFFAYFKQIGFEWLLNNNMPDVPVRSDKRVLHYFPF